MSEGSDRAVPPVRIELATSEIEGGPCRAWADPVQVMAAVAVSHPPETFAKSLLPSLEELSEFSEFGYSANGLPMLVQAVLERLQNAHVKLWRENASGLHGLQSAAITCAVAEEDRVYFIKTSSAWVCLLRGGKAHPVERLDEQADESSGLGATEKLGLAVTSLPVQPGDIVVLLASEMNWAPDLRAVVNVFGQTTDLKRACDGLVNLLGLQSEGAGAVAFRFIPVGAESREVENPLADLAGPMSLAALGAAGAAIDAANQREADVRAQKEAEYAEQVRLEREAAENARVAAAHAEQARLEAEAAERARLEAERAAEARHEAETAERARMEAERAEQARLEAEALERARMEAERAEQARLEAEAMERARMEAERAEQARLEAEAARHARMEAAREEQARRKAEAAEQARLEAERARAEAVRAEQARLEAEALERTRMEAERAEQARREAEARTRMEAGSADRSDDPFADMTASMPEPQERFHEGPRSDAESFLESLGGGPAAEETEPVHPPSTQGMSPDQFFAGALPSAGNGRGRSTPNAGSEGVGEAAQTHVDPRASLNAPPAYDPPTETAFEAPTVSTYDPPVGTWSEPQARAENAAPQAEPEGELVGAAVGAAVTAAMGNDAEGASSGIEKSPDGVVAVAYRRPPSRDEYRGKTFFWPVLLAVLLGIAIGLAAIPGGVRIPGADALKGMLGGMVSSGSGTGPTGELHIESDPPPRRILVSGQDPIEGSVAHLERMPIGTYDVQLDLGPCGLWKTKVDVREGETTELRPTLRGQVKVAASDPTRNGFVWVKGGEKQPVPATLEGLEVGWQRVFYEDEGLPIWERQVLVRTDKVASVLVPNDLRKGEGMVRVEALVLRDGLGLVESQGDSVWVDDDFVGATPLESRLAPGLHSVRVRAGDEYHTEMLELHGGGAQHVMAQFGLGSKPRLRHTSPGNVALSGSLVLTTEVESKDGSGVRQPLLHFPHLDSSLQEIPLSQVEPGRGVWVAIVDPLRMPRGEEVQYYFSAATAAGDQVYSDLYTMTIGGRSPVSANRTRAKAEPKAEDTALANHSVAAPAAATPTASAGKPAGAAKKWSGSGSTTATASTQPAPVKTTPSAAPATPSAASSHVIVTDGTTAGTAQSTPNGAGGSGAVPPPGTPETGAVDPSTQPSADGTAESIGDGEATEPDPTALLGTLPEVRREIELRKEN